MSTHIQPTEETRAVRYKLLTVSSPAFHNDGPIPSKYTCEGSNSNPPLDIEAIPEDAQSLAIIVDDPDAPAGTWVHWVIWNIPVTHHIKEKQTVGTQGMNDYGRHCYDGPCPPSGPHRYFFKVYALDSTLDIPVSSNKADLLHAISDHILAFGESQGIYERQHHDQHLLL